MSEQLIGGLAQRLAATTVRAIEAERQRDQLRALLAPLLTDPTLEVFDSEGVRYFCRLCQERALDYHRFPHAPDCAVLRADALLGRAGGGEGGAG